MLYSTQGIVFGSTKFKETSIIVKIYTEQFGMQSYLVNGVRSNKSRGKSALYQPLSLLNMVVYNKPGKDIQRVSEAKFALTYRSIPFNPFKRTIGIFLTEILGKVLREESHNSNVFKFIFHSLELFDTQTINIQNFHLQLLIKTTHQIGFGPENGEDFVHQISDSGYSVTIDANEETLLTELMNKPYGSELTVGNVARRTLLDHILKFYQIHLGSLGEIKSLKVLKDIVSA